MDRVLLINITTAIMDTDVIRRIVEKNRWKFSYGVEGDILWTGIDTMFYIQEGT